MLPGVLLTLRVPKTIFFFITKIDTLTHLVWEFGNSMMNRTEIDDDRKLMKTHDLDILNYNIIYLDILPYFHF